jgi:hypothetical protein
MQLKQSRVLWALSSAVLAGVSLPALADPLLGPGDFVRAVDSDVLASGSSYPPQESPAKAIDNNALSSKYLNGGGRGTGFIVTPGAPAAVGSFVLTSGNDADGRDPAAYVLFGTNAPISSADNSNGLGEAWTFIQQGRLSLPPGGAAGRNVAYPTVNVAGSGSFSSYKLYFPELRNNGDPNMQFNEAQFFTGANGGGTAILAPGNPILAIDAPISQGFYPENESPQKALDADAGSKYLNFGKENSGIVVTPAAGKSVVTGLKVTTANDSPERDPVAFAIYGTNDALSQLDNQDGTEADWTLIHTGALDPSTDRGAESPLAAFANTDGYTSYKILFTGLRDSATANSMQVAGIQLEGTLVPEPGTLGLAGAAALALVGRRRRRLA